MSELAIRVEHLGKQYRLGGQKASYSTFRETLVEVARAPLRWLKVERRSAQNRFWALDDVSFEVKQGEAVGIIGRNGAGKSTLLKILSRITSPTHGRVDIYGRVGSLLEVGTGFHPELTGRENIFLNGAILGMSRVEILRKFDEIVAFAEIDKFLDTPVKYYSSGMYVRLAFAVAAHLEPEILVVDEVLAVGDAAFQKKCLGKMGDVAHQGRTVLFVSHNMVAIKGICARSILINSGKLQFDDESEVVVSNYLRNLSAENNASIREWGDFSNALGSGGVLLKRISINPIDENENAITTSSVLKCNFQFWNNLPNDLLNFSIILKTLSGIDVFNTVSTPISMPSGLIDGTFFIPSDFLNEGTYSIRVLIVKDKHQILLNLDDAIIFEVHDNTEHHGWYGKWPGVLHPKFDWAVSIIQNNSSFKLL